MKNTKPIRLPAVAGSFYQANPEALKRQIEECFTGEYGPGRLPVVTEGPLNSVVGLVCPHAGYMYSGYAAAHSFASLASDGQPELVVLIGPNHRGWGRPISVAADGAWQTPLGTVDVDRQAAQKLLSECKEAYDDPLGHTGEHSLEVQLPFLQYLYGNNFRILPIVVYTFGFQTMCELGTAVASVVRDKNAVIIASSDFTHYEPESIARRKDMAALKHILELDAENLCRTVEDMDITMCGAGPIIAMLTAAKLLGATSAKLNTYYSSGAITGDTSEVVGYASVTIMR